MKTGYLALLIILFEVSSCRNDIELYTESSAIPVVYCIINPYDSVYRIQLTKTFGGDTSAAILAQDPSTTMFDHVDITLEAWKDGYRIWNTSFEPTEYGRNPGFFTSAPGSAFETTNVLTKTFGLGTQSQIIDYYRLVVNFENNPEAAISRISSSISSPSIIFPTKGLKEFKLYDSIPYYVEFLSREQYYYELRLKLNYLEQSENVVEKYCEFGYRYNIPVENGPFRQEIKPDKFFRLLAENLKDSVKVLSRKFVSLDLYIYMGSSSVKNYFETYYSDNDHGYKLWNCFSNGIGLFGLRASSSLVGLRMDQTTLDSLSMGRYTKGLKFNRW